MYKLFTDKTELFECNIKLEGASLKNSQARLLVESEGLNLMFKGTISSTGKCQIPIKKLKGLLDENISGDIKLEVIADDIITLLRLLIKEDINLENLSIKKDKLNNLVGTYLQENEIASNQKETIIEGVLTGLSKIG